MVWWLNQVSIKGQMCRRFYTIKKLLRNPGLFGVRVIKVYRALWIIAIPIGAVGKFGLVWLIADILNGLMAIPNLIALLALSPLIFRLTREHFGSSGKENTR